MSDDRYAAWVAAMDEIEAAMKDYQKALEAAASALTRALDVLDHEPES